MPQGKLDIVVYPDDGNRGAIRVEDADYLCIMNDETFGAPIIQDRGNPPDWEGKVVYVPRTAITVAQRKPS